MKTRAEGPCVFCRVTIQYGAHSPKTGYAKQRWMTDAWIDKQIAFWPEHMAATDYRKVYTRDTSATCTNVDMTRLWMSEWKFSVYVNSPIGRDHPFEMLEPFACPDCAQRLKEQAWPGRLAFERRHKELEADVLASHADSRRREFSLIRGGRA